MTHGYFYLLIFFIIYFIYLEDKCKHEIEEEKHIYRTHRSDCTDKLNSLDKKDKLFIRDFILDITKQKTKTKQSYKTKKIIINSSITSLGIVILSKMDFADYTLFPIAATLTYITTATIMNS